MINVALLGTGVSGWEAFIIVTINYFFSEHVVGCPRMDGAGCLFDVILHRLADLDV